VGTYDTAVLEQRARLIADAAAKLANDLSRGPNATAAGKICEMVNDFGGAVKCYEAALADEVHGVEARARLAQVALKQGKFETALHHARLLAEAAPDATFKSLGGADFSSRTVLADALAAIGDQDAALKLYHTALAAQATDGYAATRIAEHELRAGRLDAAIAMADRVDPASHPGFDGIAAAISFAKAKPGDPALQAVVPALLGGGRSAS
jgi:tetratricopeptide (TPR) repeat protein